MNVALDASAIVTSFVVLAVAALSFRLRSEPRRFARLFGRWLPLLVAASLPLVLPGSHRNVEVIAVLLALLIGLVDPHESEPTPPLTSVRRIGIPLLLGAISAAMTCWIWSANGFAPQYHDESSYLLQAGIFAQGRWADPSPPLAEFFEQFHVLVVPARASKYYPGHSLALAPGVALGFPAAGPLLLVAGTASLLFVLSRRLAGPRAAFLAWLVWTTAPGLFRFRSSYFSETTTSFLWLAVWWAAWRWKDTGRPLWLSGAAFATAWGAITRPLTMLLFSLPLLMVVSRMLIRRRNLREFMLAGIAAAAPLLLVPLWSFRTVGTPVTTPLSVYTRSYLPFDRLGFGFDERAPERSLPNCMQGIWRRFRPIHRDHQLASLPRILAERVAVVFQDSFAGPRSLLVVFALLGTLFMPREGTLAAVTALLLLVGYLVYAHAPDWSIYYLESQSVLAAAAGIGLSATLRALPASLSRPTGAVLVVAITVMAVLDTSEAWAQARRSGPRLAAFQAALASIPKETPAMVFVRCPHGVDAHESLVQNGPDLEHARLWLVHDRGDENRLLQISARNRRAFLYDEPRGLLKELTSPGAASSPSSSLVDRSAARFRSGLASLPPAGVGVH
jgi:hypothetical protein